MFTFFRSLLKRQINSRNMLFLQQVFDFMLVFCFLLWALFFLSCSAHFCVESVKSVGKIVNKKDHLYQFLNRETFSHCTTCTIFLVWKVFYRYERQALVRSGSHQGKMIHTFVGIHFFSESKLKMCAECLMKLTFTTLTMLSLLYRFRKMTLIWKLVIKVINLHNENPSPEYCRMFIPWRFDAKKSWANIWANSKIFLFQNQYHSIDVLLVSWILGYVFTTGETTLLILPRKYKTQTQQTRAGHA